MRYIDQVARSGSIQRAAKEINVAASAINRQILLLEQELGVELFERQARGMRLTASGDAIVTLTRKWRSDERRLAAEIKELQGVSQGHVRLAAMDSHVNSFLPTLVRELSISHPQISLDIEVVSTDDAVAALLNQTADLIIAFNLSPRRQIHTLWQTELPFGCVVSPTHPLTGSKTTSLQEAVQYPIALQSKALLIRRYLESRYSWLFSEGQKRIETNSLQLVKLLAKSGDYVAFTSELDAAPELLAGDLVFIPVRDHGAEPQTISIAMDGSRSLSRVVRIVAELTKEVAEKCLENVRVQASINLVASISSANT
ncbi:LysR family transcriptional regulator [Devosia sp. LC5]|uniref:LysR family transcriptional regulator n=1 Tax=Devosia sp. LC5 TaxID=1502724 RepID=UPI001362D794|nr:LysR family transcriptional regulator [Devosia sp. LC5]